MKKIFAIIVLFMFFAGCFSVNSWGENIRVVVKNVSRGSGYRSQYSQPQRRIVEYIFPDGRKLTCIEFNIWEYAKGAGGCSCNWEEFNKSEK